MIIKKTMNSIKKILLIFCVILISFFTIISLTEFLLSLEMNKYLILAMVMVMIFLLGWPLEWVPIVMIIVPIILPLIEAGHEVHLNLSKVEYMDSSGISVLIESKKLSEKKNTKFELVEVSKPVEKVLAMARKFL